MFFTFEAQAGVLAFIGEPIYVEKTDKSCSDYSEKPEPGSGVEILCMDKVFKLKYKIVEIVSGEFSGTTIDFIGFYHYWGMPHYTVYEPALVIVSIEEKHSKLQFIEPVEKNDGIWWFCEEWPENEEDEDCSKESKAQDVVARFITTFNKPLNNDAASGAH